MPVTDVFYQGESLSDIQHIEIDLARTLGELKAILIEKHGLSTEVILFLEDADESVDECLPVSGHCGHAGVKVHVHRCRHVEVAVSFNGETVHHRFAPGTTIARVKHWAAVHKFKMSEAEAGEHMLQNVGTHDRPVPGTHLGSLVSCPKCSIAFDLVPDQRINGASARTAQ